MRTEVMVKSINCPLCKHEYQKLGVTADFYNLSPCGVETGRTLDFIGQLAKVN